jgi:hypothetical protein
MASTQSPFITGAKDFVNDVARRCYLANAFMYGKGDERIIQSGPKIKDRIYLEGSTTFRSYRPGEKRNYSNPQTHQTWETEWAHYTDEMVWTEEEILKNAPDGMTKAAKMTALKDVKAQKLQRLYTSIAEGMDDVLWATPSFDKMESTTSTDNREVMSIPAMINEETNGLYTVGATGTWTTKQGLSPATYANWKPGQFTYDFDSYTDDDDGLIASVNKARRRLNYKPPTKFQQHFTKETPANRYLIVTGDAGYDLFEAALRNKGETFFTKGAADTDYGEITSGGVPLMNYPTLDSKALYNNGSGTLVTQASASKDGPRFYFFDLDHITMFFHRDKYLEFRNPREPSDQPEYWVQPVVCWYNLVFSSLKRHGILSPVA